MESFSDVVVVGYILAVIIGAAWGVSLLYVPPRKSRRKGEK